MCAKSKASVVVRWTWSTPGRYGVSGPAPRRQHTAGGPSGTSDPIHPVAEHVVFTPARGDTPDYIVTICVYRRQKNPGDRRDGIGRPARGRTRARPKPAARGRGRPP